jgi:hypothetical protein
MIRTMLPLVVGTLLAASPALAAETVQRSGLIVSTNPRDHTLTISEMGPWHGPGTKPARREIHLMPATRVELAARGNAPGGYKGRYVDRPLTATDLRPGDYATVTQRPEGGKLVATKVEVVRPGESA